MPERVARGKNDRYVARFCLVMTTYSLYKQSLLESYLKYVIHAPVFVLNKIVTNAKLTEAFDPEG